MGTQPTGTVTMLFTDIEGSTRLLQRLGRERYAEALEQHRLLLREAFDRHCGYEVDDAGDAFFVAFGDADEAVAAAAEAQNRLAAADWPEGVELRVRIGIHTGEPLVVPPKYVGIDVHRAARIMAAGHGGQVLFSKSTRELLSSALPVRDVGEHRLKDLTAAERLYQLGADEFPPLETLNQTNLPVAASPLIGRELELEALLSLLRDGTRLVTITGAGGTGKTRFALQAAAELVGEFADGVFWVPLQALADPELLLPTIASTLGTNDPLVEHIGRKRLLLLLDNLEHLLAAGPGLAQLMAGCPHLQVLATSRAPLRIAGEHELPLEPLAEDAAITLLLERAREAGRPVGRGETVALICRRLDHLPLALELAAARLKLMEPQALLVRLERRLPILGVGRRDAPERQRTLRATIDWSYELLDAGAKALFARLAVFAGSFSLSAAEAVCDADIDTLTTLADGSLLKSIGVDRLWMLETIREYAAEKLEQSSEAEALRTRHADYFVSLAERDKAGPREDEESALERIDADYDNSRAALAWLDSRADGAAMLRLLCALGVYHYWTVRGLRIEGRRWHETALAHGHGAPAALRAEGLAAASGLAWGQDDDDSARTLAEQSLSIARELDDPLLVAGALHHLGTIEDDLVRAEELLEESRRLANAAGEHAVGTLINLGNLALRRADYPRAVALSTEAVALAGEVGQTAARAVALGNLALAHSHLDEAAALPFLRESLELARDLGFHEPGPAFTLAFLLAPSNPSGAAFLIAATDSQFGASGLSVDPLEQERRQQALERVQARLADDEIERSSDEGQTISADELLSQALVLLEEIEHPQANG